MFHTNSSSSNSYLIQLSYLQKSLFIVVLFFLVLFLISPAAFADTDKNVYSIDIDSQSLSISLPEEYNVYTMESISAFLNEYKKSMTFQQWSIYSTLLEEMHSSNTFLVAFNNTDDIDLYLSAEDSSYPDYHRTARIGLYSAMEQGINSLKTSDPTISDIFSKIIDTNLARFVMFSYTLGSDHTQYIRYITVYHGKQIDIGFSTSRDLPFSKEEIKAIRNIVNNISFQKEDTTARFDGMMLLIILALLLFVLILQTFTWLIWWGNKRILRKIHTRRLIKKLPEKNEVKEEDTETNISDIVLYLRPFKTDNEYLDPIKYIDQEYNTIESLLVSELKKEGIPLAIGKPSEKKVPTGAKRIYVSQQENWQDVVLDYLEKSKLVILYIDFTPGVAWEIGQAFGKYRSKLILIPKIYGLNMIYPRIRWWSTFFLGPIMFRRLIYFFYKNLKVFPRIRRGKKYYKTWCTTFSGNMGNRAIDDSVCAIYFNNDNPVFVCAEDAKLETRLNKIIAILRMKAGNSDLSTEHESSQISVFEKDTCERNSSGKHKTPLFTLFASIKPLKKKPEKRARKDKIKKVFFPAFGRISFFEYAFFPSGDLAAIGVHGVSKKQGVKYVDIVEVEKANSRKLRITTRYVSGSFYIAFSAAACSLLPTIEELLKKSKSSGYLQYENVDLSKIELVNKRIQNLNLRWNYVFLILSMFFFWLIKITEYYPLAMIGLFVSLANAITLPSGNRVIKALCWIVFILHVVLFVYLIPVFYN